LKHARKPLPKAQGDATQGEKVEKGHKINEDEKEKEQEKDNVVKEKSTDTRDWRRSGAFKDFYP